MPSSYTNVVTSECVALVKNRVATLLGEDPVRVGVAEGDGEGVAHVLTVGREGAVLGARQHDRDLLGRGVDDACAGGKHVEEADEDLARADQLALWAEAPTDLGQLRVGDRDPGVLISPAPSPDLDQLHCDGPVKILPARVYKNGPVLADHLEIRVDEQVGTVCGVTNVVGSNQVEPVGEVAEDLGHQRAVSASVDDKSEPASDIQAGIICNIEERLAEISAQVASASEQAMVQPKGNSRLPGGKTPKVGTKCPVKTVQSAINKTRGKSPATPCTTCCKLHWGKCIHLSITHTSSRLP
eukprot:3165592-Rhodomonas_salina.2